MAATININLRINISSGSVDNLNYITILNAPKMIMEAYKLSIFRQKMSRRTLISLVLVKSRMSSPL